MDKPQYRYTAIFTKNAAILLEGARAADRLIPEIEWNAVPHDGSVDDQLDFWSGFMSVLYARMATSGSADAAAARLLQFLQAAITDVAIQPRAHCFQCHAEMRAGQAVYLERASAGGFGRVGTAGRGVEVTLQRFCVGCSDRIVANRPKAGT
jgi:hypothetical protein